MSERMITRQAPRNGANSLTAESFARDLIKEIESKISVSSRRLDLFVNLYNKEFKRQESMGILFRDVYLPNILRLMKGPLTLYALKMNGQVLIELAAILERYAIIQITELFSSFPSRQKIVRELIEKQFLDKLAKQLIVLGLWDKEDEKDVSKLKKARDGIAHKNLEIVSKELNNGKPVFIVEMDLVMSRKNVLPHIIMTARLLLKLMDRFFSKTDRGIIAQQILEGKIKRRVRIFNRLVSPSGHDTAYGLIHKIFTKLHLFVYFIQQSLVLGTLNQQCGFIVLKATCFCFSLLAVVYHVSQKKV
jgi:hypothetical protein